MWRWAMLGALGCGGGSDDTDSDTQTGDTDTTEVDLCEDVRTYDIEDATCDQMRSVYDGILDGASTCVTDDDCQALNSGCEVLLINACYRAANTCIDQGDLQAVIGAWGSCPGQGEDACPDCGTPRVFCDDGRCQVDERAE